MSEVLKKFGRYFLLDRIAQGGMAEIYRARMVATGGGGRLLVIKRIQSGYGSNEEFLKMFESEIQVTMGFSHPNIVQVYDFGEEQTQPYIAMEFVDGRNLRQFITRFGELKQPMPIDLAAYIIEQAAAGLFYAHSFKDKISGEPLNIIHRDISPQNILISYEGNVKVIDFGIAKATTNSESTRAGVIKGKPSYLSPEQIQGETLDGRCDIFALGAVLWELLVGKKLFSGENDLAVLKQIEACTSHVKPPSSLNPDVPKEMDYIVLKALAKQRESRFQSADEFRRALHKFIYTFNQDFNPGDLSYYAKDLFKGEIVEDRKRIQKLYEKAEKLLIDSTGTGTHTQTETTDGAHSGKPPSKGKAKGKREETTTVFEMHEASETLSREPKRASSPSAPPVRQARVDIELGPRTGATVPPRATRSISRNIPPKQQQDSGGLGKLLIAGALVAGIYFGWGQFTNHDPDRHVATDEKQTQIATVTATSTEKQVVTAQASTATILFRLTVANGSDGVVATIGDTQLPPTLTAAVQRNTKLKLSISKPGYEDFSTQVYIGDAEYGTKSDYPLSVVLVPKSFGILSVRSSPSSHATIYAINPKTGNRESVPILSRDAPFDQERLPPGTYYVELVNSILGMEAIIHDVKITEGKTTPIDRNLELVKEPK